MDAAKTAFAVRSLYRALLREVPRVYTRRAQQDILKKHLAFEFQQGKTDALRAPRLLARGRLALEQLKQGKVLYEATGPRDTQVDLRSG